VKLPFDISAGEFFELIRPAMLFVAALFSSWVFFDARRRRFGNVVALAWSLGTLLLTPVVFPLYLCVLLFKRRRDYEASEKDRVRFQVTIPLLYLLSLLAFLCLYLLQDSNSPDAHLARATQAKLAGKRELVLAEYRKALALEDDPHTHKLLANELAEAGYWREALAEFRLAERGGEPDDLITLRIANLLDMMGLMNQATLEYERFLSSPLCQENPDEAKCLAVAKRVEAAYR
jgi:tetratricopeptide (TPR) repeat protein